MVELRKNSRRPNHPFIRARWFRAARDQAFRFLKRVQIEIPESGRRTVESQSNTKQEQHATNRWENRSAD